MEKYVLLRAFDSAATAKEYCVLFELMGIDCGVKDNRLFVAPQHLKKAKELAEDYFQDQR